MENGSLLYKAFLLLPFKAVLRAAVVLTTWVPCMVFLKNPVVDENCNFDLAAFLAVFNINLKMQNT